MPASAPRRWTSALPDLLAFAVGLSIVWVRGWSTTDLIWSLWLSSLVIGYALIVWAVVQPALELLGLGWRHRAEVEASPAWHDPKTLVLLGMALVGAAFYLAFFTVHFGGFHFVHAQFLLSSYPLGFEFHTMNRAALAEVIRRYWPALPSAFLARRYAFTRGAFAKGESRVFGPYLQVMRMHVVIIAFSALHAAQRESFTAFAVIYALYFFPWRLLRRDVAAPVSSAQPI